MAKAHINGVWMNHSMTPGELADARALINHAQVKTASGLGELAKKIAAGDTLGQASLRNFLLTSEEALLSSAVSVNRTLKPAKQQTLEQCLEVPSLLQIGQPINEIVPVHPRRKRVPLGEPPRFRMIHNPGLFHRTAQSAVKRAISPHFSSRSFQYHGVQAAIARAKKSIKEGYIYTARLDIRDFYPSFVFDKLVTELPLPKEVVKYVVIARHMKVVMDQGNRLGQQLQFLSPHAQEHLMHDARLGIPHGSICSPIVSMFCIGRLTWLHMPGVVLINYADDFLLLALSAQLISEAVGKLMAAVANLPGGQFDLRLKATKEVSRGVDFLGHHFRIVDGTLKTSPTDANLEDLYGKLDALEIKFCEATFHPGKINKGAALKCAAEMFVTIDGWRAAFHECDNGGMRWLELPLSKTTETLEMIGVSPCEIKAAVEPWMGFEPSDYALGL